MQDGVIPPVDSERAVLALEVREAEGSLCFRTDTAMTADGDGEVQVTFDMPSLALLGGDYDLAVGVAEQDAPPEGSLDRLARFSVMRTLEAEGVADLRGAWTVAGGRTPRRRCADLARGGTLKAPAPRRTRKRAEGVYGPPGPGALERRPSPSEVPKLEDLERWAVIEVDPESSTRPAGRGAPSPR